MKPEWKLHWADHTVLQKLQQMQSALLIAQIPYVPVQLYSNASKFGAGCALLQHREDKDYPILYDSFLFTKTQRQYGTYKRELCALVEFCRRHRHFFYTSTVFTDHMPLTWFLTGQGHEGIYARWVTELRVLNIRIEYIEGARNGAADGLSRTIFPSQDCDNDKIEPWGHVELEMQRRQEGSKAC